MNEAASWHERGRKHLSEGRFAEAHACLSHAATLFPTDDTIRADLAQSLYIGGRAEEAVPLYRVLLARDPDNAAHAVGLGRSLRALGAFAEAIEIYRAVLARLPREAAIMNNIGNCQLALGQIDAAIASLREASAINPGFISAHYNLGLALLKAGQMREGWEEYRWRLQMPAHLIDGKPLVEWDGAAMPGKVLFVRPEQGLGDTIQFCRYIPVIAPRAEVVLGVPRPLLRLLRQLPGVARIVSDGDPRPDYDAACVMMSLPRLLRRYRAEDGGQVPYLRADPAAVALWRARLDQLPGPKIGLAWAGGTNLGGANLLDRRRSVPLAAFAPFRGVTFVSLQKGPAAARAKHPPEGMTLIDWSGDLEDFADTAALITALDLVISVDTAVAHLAGALGRPIWLLNRFDTDWRWGTSGETTPWYPTMRIFRQTVPGDWTAPLAAVAAALRTPAPRQPEDAAALTLRLFQADRWAEAWPRWFASRPASDWPTPRWDGAPMEGQTLLLHADSAADVLLFGRYVSATIRRSRARVVLAVPTELQRLMVGRGDAAVATAARPSHHRHCSFADLPILFRARPNTLPDIELCPSPPLPVIEAWSPRVTRLLGLRVGVAFDDPSLLTAIGSVDGVNLVALLDGITAAGPAIVVHDWSADFDDMATIAGLIVHLDLVIAGDNAIAHLAAALGRPVWLAGAAEPRWPFAPGREDNPWYPTMRQFPFGATAAIATALAALAIDTPEEQTFGYANDCYRRRDYRAAAAGFRQTLALRPDHPGALGNLAMTMLLLGRPDIAVRYAEQATGAAPGSQPIRMRFGLALHANGRFPEAVARLREARAMEPGHADTVTALGNALGATGALEEAIATLRAAVAMRPDNAGYHTNLGYALLRAGQWAEGWREHEYRPERPRCARMWNGQPLGGAPLVLRHEQGIGDIMQFARFAPLATRRAGSETYVTAPRSLHDLLRSSLGLPVLAADDPLPAGAYQFPLLSLPRLFNTTPETLPTEMPYFHTDPAVVARWRERIAALPGLRVGLCWAGNPRLGTTTLGVTDRRRSLPEDALAPFAEVAAASFVSLQVGDVPPPGVEVLDCSSELADFAETAALIVALDLVISVDTAVAHLAGALGKPVWLLNRFDTDWRWMDRRSDSVWYPTMRLFRQPSPGDWPTVVERVTRELSAFGK